jgi:hypothetical protein
MLQGPPPRPPKPPSRAARRREQHRLRTARYRKNQADGKAVAPVPYDGVIVDYLIRLHWLSEADAYDRREVGTAIERLLADSAKNNL